jgi:hypothetical protein
MPTPLFGAIYGFIIAALALGITLFVIFTKRR